MSPDAPSQGDGSAGNGTNRTYRTYRSTDLPSDKAYRRYNRKRPRLRRFLIGIAVLAGIAVIAVGSLLAYVLYFQQEPEKVTRETARLRKEVKPVLPTEPMNILVLGSDKRPKEPARSDTIILVRLFPRQRKAVMISIPRDYRVRIPGYGKRKINSAYALEGPPLTIETIEELTGLPINHYLEVDFIGFKKVVDTFGGIDVTVETRLHEDRATFFIDLEPGRHHLDGTPALAFVRFRHNAEGDFGRIRRQQQFARALMEKALNLGTIFKIPKLAQIVRSCTISDMSLTDMATLGWLAKTIPRENLVTVTLPGEPDMISGTSFVVPDEEKMKEILAAVKEPTVSKVSLEKILYGHALAAKVTDKQRQEREGIGFAVLNGTETSGVARDVAGSLSDLGYSLRYVRVADRKNYPRSLIVYSPGQLAKAHKMAQAYGYCDIIQAKRPMDVDLLLIVGNDYMLRQKD